MSDIKSCYGNFAVRLLTQKARYTLFVFVIVKHALEIFVEENDRGLFYQRNVFKKNVTNPKL